MMPYVKLPGGIVAHIRMAKPRRRRCIGAEGGHACPTAATLQCDFPTTAGKTCDVYICPAHARRVGTELDYCPAHAHQPAGLFTALVAPGDGKTLSQPTRSTS